MFSSAYFFVCFSLAYGCEIKIYSNADGNQSFGKADFYKMEKMMDANFGKHDKALQESNTLLHKTTGLLNDFLGKISTAHTKEKGKHLVDVAHGKSVKQSSTLRGDSRYNAEKAVDGNNSTYSLTTMDNPPYWWVDLGNNFKIERIEIFGRQDCCGDKFHDVNVAIGKTLSDMKLCSHFKGRGKTNQHIVFTCTVPMVGRFVKLTGTTAWGTIQIAILKEQWKEMHAAIQAGMQIGRVSPHVGKEYSIQDAGKAQHDVINNTGAQGKLVIKM